MNFSVNDFVLTEGRLEKYEGEIIFWPIGLVNNHDTSFNYSFISNIKLKTYKTFKILKVESETAEIIPITYNAELYCSRMNIKNSLRDHFMQVKYINIASSNGAIGTYNNYPRIVLLSSLQKLSKTETVCQFCNDCCKQTCLLLRGFYDWKYFR